MNRRKRKSVRVKPLTAKQRLFAVAVASGSTNIDAMRKAGFTGKASTLSVEANRLLKLPKIAEHIERARETVEKTLLRMNADELLGLAETLARADITDFVTWNNNQLTFKPLETIPPHKLRAVQMVRIKDTQFGKDRSIKLHASWPAIDRLGQYLKQWGDKLSVEFPGDVLDRGVFAIPGFAASGGAPARR